MDDVAAMAMALPEVIDGERHGRRTWFVKDKAFAWERPFSKADLRRYGDTTSPTGPVLAVSVADLGEKDAVLTEGAKGFFTIPHFDGYPAVLIDLSVAGKRAVRTKLLDAWLAAAPRTLAGEHLARRRTH